MNPLWLDQKYILLVAHRLRNFKRKSAGVMNMSCPFCGDSKTNKRKARGYIYDVKGSPKFHCHNCGITRTFPKFLQYIDPTLYDEYIRERFVSNTKEVSILDTFTFEAPKFSSSEHLKTLMRVDKLSQTHPVKKWVNDRLIPESQHRRLFFVKKFMEWVNTIIPDKFEEGSLKRDEPRLVIPMVDKDNNLLGFQGRSFLKSSDLRYITIMLDVSFPKIFGLDCVDPNKPIMVVEGPIDSLFLPNAVASAGADLTSNLDVVSEDISKFTLVFDREPRNIDIGKRVVSAIEKGYTVALLPDTMPGKDINDYRKAGLTQDQIVSAIQKHAYSGLEAMMEFQTWKKW